MATVAKFLGHVIGRNHAPTLTEITGIPLPYTVITHVRVTCRFPGLATPEVVLTFDELPKDDFAIGQAITLTLEHTAPPQPSVVEAAEAARAEVAAAVVTMPAPPPPVPEPVPAAGATEPAPMEAPAV